jgi:formate dehydrogenase major subunit
VTVAGLATAFGSGAMTNSIQELQTAEVILILGSNTYSNHPVVGMQIKQAVRQGKTKLIVVDPRRVDLAESAEIHLPIRPGTDVALLNGLMRIILEEGLQDQEFIKERTEGFEELKVLLDRYTPEYVAEITGVPGEDIIRAARLYAQAKRASIVYCMGLTQHSVGVDNVWSAANLAMLTGNVGKEGTGVNPLRGQNNVQGACDMGGLPNVLTAYQPVISEEVRARFAQVWGVNSLPAQPGLPLTEAMEATHAGRIKGMYLIGENPMVSDPDLNHVEHSLNNLDFFVVQDIFLTETAKLADVVLPTASFAEKDGTFTNTERRVQRVRKAINPPGKAMTDLEIIMALANQMGYPMHYASAEEVFEEIRQLTASYAGITYQRLEEGGGLPWPCPAEDHPGTSYLHKGRFTRGQGKFHPVEFKPPAENPDQDYPLVLTTGRSYYHYHTGTMTRRSKALDEFVPEAWVEINQVRAEQLGITEGEMVQLTSRRGQLKVKALLTNRVREEVVFMPFHFAEAAANLLTNAALDPVAKIPEFKVCAVRVEKAS